MHGICQLVWVLVVVLMTIDQGMSWEEIQNGQSNQDDDFLSDFSISVPDDNSRQDALPRPSEINGKKKIDQHVVPMKAEDTHPKTKDESRDQARDEVSHDRDEHNKAKTESKKEDELSEATLVANGDDPEINVDTGMDEEMDISPGALDEDPDIEADTDEDSDAPPKIGPSPTKVDHPLDLSLIEVYGDDDTGGKEIDCTDGRFMDSVDCLLSSPADANLSKEGLKARQQLFDFMELKRQKRQTLTETVDSNVFDEGSGTGDIYPDSTNVVNGTYVLEWGISFNVTNITDSTEEDLEAQLWRAFSNVTGFLQVNVTDIRIVNGTLMATYEVVISGQTVSGFGVNEQEVVDSLYVTLSNVTAPEYNTITIEGETPLSPFDPTGFADAVGELLSDICSTENPCPDSFSQCNATGLDEGVCLHLCYIFQLDGVCEHGGTCELNDNSTAFCSCTDNWRGERCQDAVTSDALDDGEIAGATVGAVLVVIGIIGMCCWFLVCRKGTRNIHMTHYSDDASGSDRFSNPSSKISTFVIDRPRISTSPFNAFNPGHSTSPYQHTSVRGKPTLFSDA